MTGVVTALSHRWESPVAATIEPIPGISVVRRCADVAELISVTAAGLGQCAVVSADLRGLDLSVVDHLHRHAVWVVGVYPPGDETDERRLRQLSVDLTLPVDATAEVMAGALIDRLGPRAPADLEALESLGGPAPAADRCTSPLAGDVATGTGVVLDELPAGARVGQVFAVWGPTGAPGRTTTAVTLASELASRGRSTLLIDADTYGGSVAQVLGLLDEAPGLAAACRAAEHGTLDLPVLAALAPEVVPRLRVLTGLPRADRWTEIRAAALERVLEVSRSLAAHVIVDCGFCLEDDEELSYDTLAPRRNEATLTSLALCDRVVAVGGADPVALQRFVRGLRELGTVPSGPVEPVINRVRASAVGGKPKVRIGSSLERFAGLSGVHYLPDDPVAADAALLAGRSVVEQAPQSELRGAIAELAMRLAPGNEPGSTRRQRRRVRRNAPTAAGGESCV